MREMTTSKTPWISEYPADWDQVPLHALFGEHKNKNKDGTEQNLLSLSYGNIIRKDINTNEGLLPESFNGYNIIDEGDIVLRLTDLQNDHRSLRTGLVTEHGIITSAYITLRKKAPLSSEYYHYLLHAFDIMKVFYSMGEGIRQSLGYDELAYTIIPRPSLPEQRAIVRYLDSKCSAIDEAIERHKKIIEKLEEYELCVITDEINKSHGLQIRIKYIGDVQTGPFGTQLSASEYTEFGTPCINVKNIKNGYLAEDDLDRVPDAVLLRLPNHILHVGDIVFARKGSIDKHALVTLNEKGWMQGSDCIRLRPVNALPEYLNYALASNMVKNYLRSTATGSTMPSLTSDMIKELPVVIPSINIQQDIISRLDKIMTSIMKSKQKHDEIIGKLEEYRKSLIYNAVTGKIDCRTEAAR